MGETARRDPSYPALCRAMTRVWGASVHRWMGQKEGQKQETLERIIKRGGCLTRCGGSGEGAGKRSAKISPWVII